MHEHDVRLAAPCPRVGQVPGDPRQVVEILPRVEVHLDPCEQRVVQRRRRRRRAGWCVPGQLGPAGAIEVELLVVERHCGIERVPRHHDVRDAIVERDAVEGRVRLDESTVGLRVECGDDLVDRAGRPVEPRREVGDRRRQLGRAEHEQRADVLHPRRAVLRARTDDDVAVTELEPVPARTVLVRGRVPVRRGYHGGERTDDRASDGEVEAGPCVGVHLGAVGSVHAEPLMVERGAPVAMLVEERVVSSTEMGSVGEVGGSAVFPVDDVVDVAPGGGDLTSGPLTVG